MGLEASCKCSLNGLESDGKAHCGDGELTFRGDFKFRWKWERLLDVEVENGVLFARHDADTIELALGSVAEKWRDAILNPKSRMDKFGVKRGHRCQVWGTIDESFTQELAERVGTAQPDRDLDVVFVRLYGELDLPKLLDAKYAIVDDGMIWAIWVKGVKEFGETMIRNFATGNGLVDVKIASVSETLTSAKFVIPVKHRKSRK